MKKLVVRQTVFQAGEVKICVPICGRSDQECLDECAMLKPGIDVVEWRMDYLAGTEPKDWLTALRAIRSSSQSLVLLATWRSAKEGGKRDIAWTDYLTINRAVIQSGLIDMIDVELFSGEEIVTQAVNEAHEHGVKVVMSHHDIQATPPKAAMRIRLEAMQRMGGDLVKLAVMPQCAQDVWDLLSVSSAFSAQEDSCPLISMAMGDLGVISRYSPLSGSVMSFGALRQASAPGQLPWQTLKQLLTLPIERKASR